MNAVTSSRPKILSVFSLVMINVIAVDSLRTLPISAELGFSLVFFYLIAALLFFIPTALVAAELATGWPATGGIYIWVREAFGERIGFFIIWLQWIYNVVWYPTMLAFIAATMAYLINPALANNKTYLLTCVLSMFWLSTIVNCFGMRLSSWVSATGAIVGTLLPMTLIIILGGIWAWTGRPEHVQFTWHAFYPEFSNLRNLVFFTAVLFGLLGLEMSAVHAGDVKNPQRDYPRALLYSAIIILVTLVLSSLAIAMVVPKDQLSLVSGLIDAFDVFFKAYHMPWMLPVIAIMIIIGGLSGVAAWVIGPTKGLLIAARDGEIPEFFSRVTKKGVPINILLTQAVFMTIICSVFLLIPSVAASYLLLSEMTAQLALLVYIFMFAAVIRLRYSKANTKRTYKIPGGKVGVWLVSSMGIGTCFVAIILGFIPPPQVALDNIWNYEFILITGVVVFCLLPFLITAGTAKQQ